MMEHIIKLSESSSQGEEINPEQFSLFMQRKPIWQFYSLTQDCYLQKTNQEKIRLINNYYKSMMEGKICFFMNRVLNGLGIKRQQTSSINLNF